MTTVIFHYWQGKPYVDTTLYQHRDVVELTDNELIGSILSFTSKGYQVMLKRIDNGLLFFIDDKNFTKH